MADRCRRRCLREARTRARLSHPWVTVPLRTFFDSRRYRLARRRRRARGSPKSGSRSGHHPRPSVAFSRRVVTMLREKKGVKGVKPWR